MAEFSTGDTRAVWALDGRIEAGFEGGAISGVFLAGLIPAFEAVRSFALHAGDAGATGFFYTGAGGALFHFFGTGGEDRAFFYVGATVAI
jgi:hypothetical protein